MNELTGIGGHALVPVQVKWDRQPDSARAPVFHVVTRNHRGAVEEAATGVSLRCEAELVVLPRARANDAGFRVAEPGWDTHLRADPDLPGGSVYGPWADVLAATVPVATGTAHERVAELLEHYPGCLVAAVPEAAGGCTFGVRGRGTVRMSPVTGSLAASGRPAALASFLHGWLVSGRSERELESLVLMASGMACRQPEPHRH